MKRWDFFLNFFVSCHKINWLTAVGRCSLSWRNWELRYRWKLKTKPFNFLKKSINKEHQQPTGSNNFFGSDAADSPSKKGLVSPCRNEKKKETFHSSEKDSSSGKKRNFEVSRRRNVKRLVIMSFRSRKYDDKLDDDAEKFKIDELLILHLSRESNADQSFYFSLSCKYLCYMSIIKIANDQNYRKFTFLASFRESTESTWNFTKSAHFFHWKIFLSSCERSSL